MIYSLAGEITYKDNKSLVLENQGVGYRVFCSPNTLRGVYSGVEANIFTHLHLKEDVIELYGFLKREELELFETLNEISGIGPKTAMMLASLGSLEKLKEIMESGKLPSEIKGIGQKRMQKILLELTGKVKELKISEGVQVNEQALSALVSLGFSKQAAKEALTKISINVKDNDKMVQEALKIIGR